MVERVESWGMSVEVHVVPIALAIEDRVDRQHVCFIFSYLNPEKVASTL